MLPYLCDVSLTSMSYDLHWLIQLELGNYPEGIALNNRSEVNNPRNIHSVLFDTIQTQMFISVFTIRVLFS